MTSSLHQRGGADSVQIQAARDVVIGVDESRAREIAEITARQVIEEYTAEAHDLIQERIFHLDDRVIAALVRAGRIEAFADPGFQRSYRKAQNGAATTERETDYEMLAALVADRAVRGENRPVRAGIERAIEIVDQVDDDALRGLTVFQAVSQYTPTSGTVSPGLDTMDTLLGQLLDGPLPEGSDWLDHLDVLDAIRINTATELRKFAEYYPDHLVGYVAPGVPAEEAPATIGGDFPDTLWGQVVVPHELREGHVRIATPTAAAFDIQVLRVENAALAELMVSEAKARFGLGSRDEQASIRLMEEVRGRPALNTIATWWDSIPNALSVTSVGRVLARASAYGRDEKNLLPPLD